MSARRGPARGADPIGGALTGWIDAGIDRPLAPEVRDLALDLARAPGVEAVLFYGSNLRTRSLDGVLDFYVLMGGGRERGVWPRVGWVERDVAGRTLRAKTAIMTLATFDLAARGRLLDTTIWARFVQPVVLAWARDALARRLVVDALAAAAITAARLAAALGPPAGSDADYWAALFRATYRAELRVEAAGRERAILAADPAHFAQVLPLAWAAGDVRFADDDGRLHPALTAGERQAVMHWWLPRRIMGKPLNLRRLARATTTFDGAARYAAWKIERHTGLTVALPTGADRHPLLAVPALAQALWRGKLPSARGQDQR